MDVSVLSTRSTYDFLFFAESVFKFGLNERGNDGQLEVNDTPLQAF